MFGRVGGIPYKIAGDGGRQIRAYLCRTTHASSLAYLFWLSPEVLYQVSRTYQLVMASLFGQCAGMFRRLRRDFSIVSRYCDAIVQRSSLSRRIAMRASRLQGYGCASDARKAYYGQGGLTIYSVYAGLIIHYALRAVRNSVSELSVSLGDSIYGLS